MRDLRKYWIWLSHAAGQGSKNAVNLIRKYSDAKTVYKSNAEELSKSGLGIDKRVIARLANKDLSECESILSWCSANNVKVIVPTDPEYPKSLLSLQDAPMVLYVLGKLPDFEKTLCCAMVGTREMSEYGKTVAYEIGAGLAYGGACVVSGIALGIDSMAIAGALEAGGTAVAVLGNGIDIVYPKQHAKLYKKVLEKNGAIITEYAPGVSPRGHNFPVRNRIISGLSQAVCVVEGDMKSGSLITARHAIYQGRALYAVPGRIGEKGAEGTNYLLKEGATPVTDAVDILSDYEFIYPLSVNIKGAHPTISPAEAEEKHSIGSRGKKSKKENQQEGTPKKERPQKPKKGESPFPPEEKKVSNKPSDIESLGDFEKKVFENMEDDMPMLCEEIAEKTGEELSKVLVALTLLEIAGAVEAGAGGYYLKRGADYGSEREYITEEDDGL